MISRQDFIHNGFIYNVIVGAFERSISTYRRRCAHQRAYLQADVFFKKTISGRCQNQCKRGALRAAKSAISVSEVYRPETTNSIKSGYLVTTFGLLFAPTKQA